MNIDPTVMLVALAMGALAATLTITIWRILTRPSEIDRFDDALAAITGNEEFSGDTSLAKNPVKPKVTWNGYWLEAFAKAGRTPSDDATPGRIALGVAILAAFFGFAVFPGAFSVLFPVGALVIMSLWLSLERSRRKGLMEKQLPLLLSGLRNQMQAGMTPQGAIIALADDLPSPLGDEIRQVKADVSVSVPLEVSLENLAKRSQSQIMQFLVASMGIAIRSGSDLIPQLVVIEETVRQRARIQGKINSALAMAKPTAYISMAAPVVMGGWMFITDPSYPKFYFSSEGWIMFAVALALYAAGVFTVRVMVSNVEKI